MNKIMIKPIDTKEIQDETKDIAIILQKSKQIIIKNNDQYITANSILKEIKNRYKELDDKRKEITAPLDVAKKAVMNLFKPILENLEEAERIVKKNMIDYAEEQERIAREMQRKIEEESARKAEIERKRKEEQEQKWREKQHKLEKEGEIEKALAAQEKADLRAMEAEMIEAEIVPLVVPKIAANGTNYREQWIAEIINENDIPREYMIPNLSAINKVVQATKGLIKIPGVKIYSRKVLVSR